MCHEAAPLKSFFLELCNKLVSGGLLEDKTESAGRSFEESLLYVLSNFGDCTRQVAEIWHRCPFPPIELEQQRNEQAVRKHQTTALTTKCC